MKRIILITIFVFLMCSFSSAQSLLPELEKAKEIKLLETSPEEVKGILEDYNLTVSDYERHYDEFSSNDAILKISYSSGSCDNKFEEWDIPEWKVSAISITLRNRVKIVGIDYSKFKKEKIWRNISSQFIFHNKKSGIAFGVYKKKIRVIYLFPSIKQSLLLCKNEAAKSFLNKNWFESDLKERLYIHEPDNLPPDVINLTLSKTEIISNCLSNNSTQNKSCSESNTKIAVLVSAKDPENDPLIYHYEVSGGKIIGQGSSVIWDLSEVKAGTYTIKTTADDGCGFCGKSMTKTVTVKDCSDCQ